MEFVLKFLVDLIYVILAVTTVIIFTCRGFIDSVFRFGRTIMAGLICYFVGPVVSDLIYEKLIYNGILEFVSERIERFLVETVGSIDIQGLIDSLPFIVRQLVDREEITARYGDSVEGFDEIAADFAESVASPLSALLSNLIAYVAVFLLSMLALFLAFKLLDGIFKLPVLNAINKTLGCILGVAAAFLLLGAITFLLGLLVGVLGSTSTLKQLIEMSALFRWFSGLSIFNLF